MASISFNEMRGSNDDIRVYRTWAKRSGWSILKLAVQPSPVHTSARLLL